MSEDERSESVGQDGWTRRAFMGGAAATLAAFGLGSRLPSLIAQPARAAGISNWDAVADVVVLGLGGAGAAAAVSAHDAGARVLILEKQGPDRHINNTVMSGGIFHSPKKGMTEQVYQYARAMMSGDNLPPDCPVGRGMSLEGEHPFGEDVARTFARYAPYNMDFLKSLDPDIQFLRLRGASFPDFPGAESYDVYTATYQIPMAADATWKSEKPVRGAAFFKALMTGVTDRKIDVRWHTDAERLVVNEDGVVVGVIAHQDGKTLRIKARKGVVLTTGGFEYSPELRHEFVKGPSWGWGFYGSTENTGQGVKMALGVGAMLGYPYKMASRIIMKVPVEYHGLEVGLITPAVGKARTIVVDNYGHRYAPENAVTDDPSRYFFYEEAVYFDIYKLEYPRLPSWLIFDEEFRSNACLTDMQISTAGFGIVPWSQDNMDAIRRGWILKGDTIEELAQKIAEHPRNFRRMTPEALAQEVKQFNSFVAQGEDKQFGRRKATMGPIEKGPFYAAPLYAGGPNTKGGPVRNGKAQIVDWNGQPVPHLYGAGELGSVFAFVYQGGGNLTECLVYGRVAGENAAREKAID